MNVVPAKVNPDNNPSWMNDATPTEAGAMSAADKAKLDAIAPGGGIIVWNFGTPWSSVLPFIEAGASIVLLDPGASGGVFHFTMGPESADLSHTLFLVLDDSADSQAIVDVDPAFRLLGHPTLNLQTLILQASAEMYNGPDALSLQLNDASITRNAGTIGPLFTSPFARITLVGSGIQNGDITDYVVRVDGGVSNVLIGVESSSLDTHTLAGTGVGGNAQVDIQANDDAGINAAAIGPNTTLTVNFTSLSQQIAYTPAAGNFANPQPTEVANALDRIAAVVKALNGGVPIP